MKLVVFFLLMAVIVSLASGLFYLRKDSRQAGGSRRMLKALKVRVVLSVLLILVLVSSYYFGWISPQGYIQ